ncbi:MAG: hypothetical protein PF961_07545 [Planctomycetota bacterium]|jgi:hypothetical protein|nr:hypothetical protein [Planctomycetota bacterium]
MTWRCLSVMMLTLSLGAAEISWPGGEISLAEACALLNDAGYPTELAIELDASQRADLPLLSGSYWHALSAMGTAFGCAPSAPATYLRFRDTKSAHGSTAVEIEGGPVQLSPGQWDHDLWQINGPMLVQIEDAGVATTRGPSGTHRANAAAVVRLRLSPNIDLDSLGPASLAWTRIRAGDGSELQAALTPSDHDSALPTRQRSPRRGAPLSVLIGRVDPLTTTLVLEGHVTVTTATWYRQEHDISPGRPCPLEFGGHRASAMLYNADLAQNSHWQRPGLALTLPKAAHLVAEPTITVTTRTGEAVRGFGTRMISGDSTTCFAYLHQVDNAGYRLLLSLGLESGQLTIPLRVQVTLPP